MRCSTWLTRPSRARSQLTIQHALTRTRPQAPKTAPFARDRVTGSPQTGFRFAGGGWLAGEAFPAAELLKPETLLQREGLAAHLPAQFVELLPFLGGNCSLDGLAAHWLGFGHRPVKPSRPPHNPHFSQGIGVR